VSKSHGPPTALYRARSAYKASRTIHLSLEIMEPVVFIGEVDPTCWWVGRPFNEQEEAAPFVYLEYTSNGFGTKADPRKGNQKYGDNKDDLKGKLHHGNPKPENTKLRDSKPGNSQSGNTRSEIPIPGKPKAAKHDHKTDTGNDDDNRDSDTSRDSQVVAGRHTAHADQDAFKGQSLSSGASQNVMSSEQKQQQRPAEPGLKALSSAARSYLIGLTSSEKSQSG
jgi:hypothetical protein